MKKFEYKFYQFTKIDIKKELNELGSQDWELIYYQKEDESIFKKEVEMIVNKKLEVLNEQFSDEINLENLKKDQ